MPKRYAIAPPLGKPGSMAIAEPPAPPNLGEGLAGLKLPKLKGPGKGANLGKALAQAPAVRERAERVRARERAQAQAQARPKPSTLEAVASTTGALADRAEKTRKLRQDEAKQEPAKQEAPKQEAPKQEAPKQRRPMGAPGPETPGKQPMQPARAPDTGTKQRAQPVPQKAPPTPVKLQPKGQLGQAGTATDKENRRVVLHGRMRQRKERVPGSLGVGEAAKAPPAPAPEYTTTIPSDIPPEEEAQALGVSMKEVLAARGETDTGKTQPVRDPFQPEQVNGLPRKRAPREDSVSEAPTVMAPSKAPQPGPATPRTELPEGSQHTRLEGLLHGAARADEAGNIKLRDRFLRRFRAVVRAEQKEQRGETFDAFTERMQRRPTLDETLAHLEGKQGKKGKAVAAARTQEELKQQVAANDAAVVANREEQARLTEAENERRARYAKMSPRQRRKARDKERQEGTGT